MKSDYRWWRAAVSGKDAPPIHVDRPECGRYKTRRKKGGPYKPVAIWRDDDGSLRAAIGHDAVDPYEIWTWCAKEPVSESDYKHAVEHGHFPGELPPAVIGDNRPPEDIVDEISTFIDNVVLPLLKDHKEITDSVTSDLASNIMGRLRELGNDAEKQRAAEKEPHLEAGRAVDKKYKPAIELAKTYTTQLSKLIGKWFDKEKARIAAEQVASGAHDIPPEPIKVQAGGARGRKIGAREYKVAVIVDYDKALAYFARHKDVEAVIHKLAQHAARDGHEVPGVEVRTETGAQ